MQTVNSIVRICECFVKVLLWENMLEVILYILYAILLAVFILGVWRLRYGLHHFRVTENITGADVIEDMPSVTVCIPARNEDHAMSDCLKSVIANTYPKLEIIVHDDLSGDSTSSLIKAFAKDGVRFIEGEALPHGWLGKNNALHSLAKEASGTYVLFMDVDTVLEPESIAQLVAYASNESVDMVSILPRRNDNWRASVFFAPLRYFWEIVFHRPNAPATASNAWMIHRQVLLQRFQGLESVKNDIQPESTISAALMADNKYRFLIGTEALGVSYQKKWRSQMETSIRLLFPLLGAKVLHSVMAVLDLLIVASPLIILLASIFTGWGAHQYIAVMFIIAYAGLYGAFTRKVRRHAGLIGALVWPLIVVQEVVLIIISTLQYVRKKVTWKGRRVSLHSS